MNPNVQKWLTIGSQVLSVLLAIISQYANRQVTTGAAANTSSNLNQIAALAIGGAIAGVVGVGMTMYLSSRNTRVATAVDAEETVPVLLAKLENRIRNEVVSNVIGGMK